MPRLGARSSLWFLALVVVIGTAIRIYGSSDRSFWFDEAFFWRLSQFPVAELIARTAQDNYPPLYPLALKGWSAIFGASPFALRSLSVLFGAATIVGMYLFSLEAFSHHESPRADDDTNTRRARATALFTAALVALSVFQIRAAWDVKVYSLGAMLAALSSWAMFRAMRVKSFSSWLTYVGLALALLYTHYFALFSVFAQLLFAAARALNRSRYDARRLIGDQSFVWSLATVGVLLIGWAPWLPTFLDQHDRDRSAALRKRVTFDAVLDAPYAMFRDPDVTDAQGWQPVVLFALCELTLFGLPFGARAGDWYVFLAAIVPPTLAIAISVLDTAVFEVRYLAFAHLFWLVAVAVLVSRIRKARWRRLLGGCLLGAMTVAHVEFCNQAGFAQRPGARGAARELDERVRDGEPIIVCSQLYYYPLLYHCRKRNLLCLFDDRARVRWHCWGSAIILDSELISGEALASLNAPRVWVVDMDGGWGASWPLRVPVPRGWARKSERRFPGTWRYEGTYRVVEYENRGPVRANDGDELRNK